MPLPWNFVQLWEGYLSKLFESLLFLETCSLYRSKIVIKQNTLKKFEKQNKWIKRFFVKVLRFDLCGF
jgi:putative component of membrane protein insertase Oxa1/YidC/SpoIIIJ protein YidD